MRKKFLYFLVCIFMFSIVTNVNAAGIIVVGNDKEGSASFSSGVSVDKSETGHWKYDATTKTLTILDNCIGSCKINSIQILETALEGTDTDRPDTITIVMEKDTSIENYYGSPLQIGVGAPKVRIVAMGDNEIYGGVTPSLGTEAQKGIITFDSNGLEIVNSYNLTIGASYDADESVPLVTGTNGGNLTITNSDVRFYLSDDLRYAVNLEGGKLIVNRSDVDFDLWHHEYEDGPVDTVRIKSTENPFQFVNCHLYDKENPYSKEIEGETYWFLPSRTDGEGDYYGTTIESDALSITDYEVHDDDWNVIGSIYAYDENNNRVKKALPGDKIYLKISVPEGYALKENSLRIYHDKSKYDSEVKTVYPDSENSFIMPDVSVEIFAIIYNTEEVARVEYIYVSDYDREIEWRAIDYADGYEIYRSTDNANWKLIKNYTFDIYKDVSYHTYKDTGALDYGKTYYYKVRAYRLNEDGTKVYGEYSNSAKKVAKLYKAYIDVESYSYNTNKVYVDKQTFADGYEIYRSTDKKKWTKIGTVANNSNSSYYVTYNDKKASLGKTYYYKARAYKTVGKNKKYSDYSNVQSVKTRLATPKVTTSYVNSTSIKVSWGKVTKATSYNVYKYDYATGKKTKLASVKGTSYTIKNLTKNRSYYIVVVAVNGKNTSEDGMAYGSTVAPMKTSTTYVDYKTLKFNWKKVDGVTGYVVCLYDSNYTYERCEQITDLDQTSFTFDELNPARTYTFESATFYYEGDEVYISNSQVIKSLKAKPVTPAITLSNTNYNKATISWNAVAEATGYEVYRSTDNKKWTKVATVKDSLSYENGGLTTGKKYYYKVRAYTTYNGKNYYGSYSSVKNITPKVKTPTTTVSNANYNSIKITWNKVDGASGYEVYRSTDNKKWTKVSTVGSGTASYTDKKVTYGKKYYYKVRAYRTVSKKKQYGSYSGAVNAVVKVEVPKVNAVLDEAVTLTWNKVAGASGYEIYVSDTADGTYKLLKTVTGNSYVHEIGESAPSYYKVRAYRTIKGKKNYGNYSAPLTAAPQLEVGEGE